MTIRSIRIETSLGPVFLAASARGINKLLFSESNDEVRASNADTDGVAADQLLARATAQLHEYLTGERRTFDVPLDVGGTVFQRRVWSELALIPFGETRSYTEVARAAGVPRASRAVGTANGRNPVCILVPCHRVIAADGSLGGYSGGLPIKRALLKLEGRQVLPENRPPGLARGGAGAGRQDASEGTAVGVE